MNRSSTSVTSDRATLRPASGVIALLLFLLLTLVAPSAAQAQECGCTKVGPYKAPARTAPAAQELSPNGGSFRLETSQHRGEVTLSIKRASNGTTVENFFIPVQRAQWGFSPDGNRFMYRHAFPEPIQGSPQVDVIVLYDLIGDRQVHYTEVRAGATAAFSPHGRWYLLNSLYGPGWSAVTVLDAATGRQALHEELLFEAPPSSPGDKFGTIGLGFSPDTGDRSFVWAYRQIGGNVELTMKNLETGSTVLSTPVGGDAWWRFSPCGDALGLANQTTQRELTATIHKTATSGLLGVPWRFSPIPDLIQFDTTLAQHRLTVVEPGTGQSTTIDVAPNTADTTCAPPAALDQLTVSPTSVIGGAANATGTVRLTRAATASLTVSLTSSDTAAATVPASVTVAPGSQTATFTVTTGSVTAPRDVTITATANGVTRTATVAVNPSTVPGLATVAVEPLRVDGGGTATGAVTLDGPTPTAVAVALASSAPGAASVPASVTVPAGASTATFTVATSSVPVDARVTITATAADRSRTAAVSVLATDRTCEIGSSDPVSGTIGSRAFRAFDDHGQDGDCTTPVRFEHGFTVDAGTTGLPDGTPVQLRVTFRFNGSVHTSPPVGAGGAYAEGSTTYLVIEDSTRNPDGSTPVPVDFHADYTLEQDRFVDPTSVNLYEVWSWELTTNDGEPQSARHSADRTSEAPASLMGDTGTVTATYWTKVGAHLTVHGDVSAVAAAYGAGSAAAADFSDGFTTSTAPGPGFEGLALVDDAAGSR